ncbi:glutamine synthetase family protein [Streptomyces sp. NPDC091267]|uniref:glutamine synthetase family protein n=1 Tax=Streptomyces sp. NPDC091267 TaxID=3155195 RepID=UPI0034390E69
MTTDEAPFASTGKPGFTEQHSVWNRAQQSAAEDLLAAGPLDVDLIRVGFGDPHGLLRTKALSPRAFRSALLNGLDMSPGPLVFDSGHALPNDLFAPGAGLSLPELTGAGDFIVVPDPLTLRISDCAGVRTAVVLGDEYTRTGLPHPLSSRGVLRRVLDSAAAREMRPLIGLELEWYLLRLLDPADRGGVGGFGVQGRAPLCATVNGGYQFNSDTLIADLLPLLAPLGRLLSDELGLPLRSIEHESGPGQIEVTFDPLGALEAADAILLARSLMKQHCLRTGHLATFMSVPAFAGADPSGWHLHQSLTDSRGVNLFTSHSDDQPLSDLGLSYVAGLLEHGAATTSLAVPTVNGYRRLDPVNSLSPDRLVWSHENRGAMVRVLGGPHDAASHVENRIGEPAANPYLYIASQLAAGLDGIDRGLRRPEAAHPHAGTGAALPVDLGQATAALRGSELVRALLGDPLRANLLALHGSAWDRFGKWAAEHTGDALSGVTAWENDEYLMAY